MAKMPNPHSNQDTRLQYFKIRDLSSKDEEANGATSHVVVMSATDLLELSFPEEMTAPPQGDPVRSAVSRTIMEYPDRFIQLHSGFVISASKITVMDDKKSALLTGATLTDGRKSLAILRDLFKGNSGHKTEPLNFSVRCTIFVDSNEGLPDWVRLTRNIGHHTNGLADLAKHQAFTDFANQLLVENPKFDLFETSRQSNDPIDAILLLQVLTAMMPSHFSVKAKHGDTKSFALTQPMKCLEVLEDAFKRKSDKKTGAAEWRYYIDMAEVAWKEYLKWKNRQFWIDGGGTNIPNFVDDGRVFPILSALSSFVSDRGGRWQISYPDLFEDDDMIFAVSLHAPAPSGKQTPVPETIYGALELVAEMAKRYSEASHE